MIKVLLEWCFSYVGCHFNSEANGDIMYWLVRPSLFNEQLRSAATLVEEPG